MFVLRLAPNTVLRPKERCQADVSVPVEKVRGVLEVVIDARRMTDQSDSRSLDQKKVIFEQCLDSQGDLMHFVSKPNAQGPEGAS